MSGKRSARYFSHTSYAVPLQRKDEAEKRKGKTEMKVLNLGSLNLDRVYTVDKFVDAGETIQAKKLEYFCGGKGLNQSIALAKAGAEVYHAGAVGKDGAILKEELEKAGVHIDCGNPGGSIRTELHYRLQGSQWRK